MRILFIKIILILMVLGVFLGFFNLQILQGNKFKDLSDKNSIRLIPQVGARGVITDRSNAVIADNSLSYDVLVLPHKGPSLERTLTYVSEVLDVPIKKIKSTYKNGLLGSSMPVEVATGIALRKAVILEEGKFNYPNIIIQTRPQRFYPNQSVASHILGYVGEIDRWRLTKLADYGYKTKDIVGFGGIEEKYDYYLRQEEGGISFEVDHQGNFVRVLGFAAPTNGKNLQLTIDLNIQKVVEEKLQGKNGSVIILDPRTGEIIAMASYPNFDPSVFVEKNSTELASIFLNSESPLLNRAISAAYPPGSIFKAVVACAGVETKKITPQSTFMCIGHAMVGKQKFNCWSTHHEQDLFAALAHSCNVFFYKTGLLVGAPMIHEFASRFGVGKTSNTDLPYEITGYLPSPLKRKVYQLRGWYDGDTANFSIGQGDLLVTPLQMTRMMAVFANGGFLVSPYLVQSVNGQDIRLSQQKLSKVHVRQETLQEVRTGLREVVALNTGTAHVLNDLDLSIAGKTGTAQAPPGQTHAWFVGFFPYDNPRYTMCVFLERGGPGYAACLLAKQILFSLKEQGLL